MHNFSWVIEGEIAGMAQPPRDDSFWQWLHNQGIRLVVSLTNAPPDKDALARHGLEVLHLPVPDFTPPSYDVVRRFLEHARFHRTEKHPIVVHCGAGIGRTGTLIACYLVDRGMEADAAIAKVRKARPGSIETPEQEATVRALAKKLRESRKAPKD